MADYPAIVSRLSAALPALEIRENEPMSEHCSFKIGGPARLMLLPSSAEEAASALAILRSSGAQERDCDDLASLAGRVQGSVCSATIRENENGGCRISLRSGFDVNSSDVCARFGGGGHPMAAGCAMDCPPDIARERLVAAIIEEWKK